MAIIAITNFKGGVGKTTSSIAVCTVLSKDSQVLLTDADQNRSALQWASYNQLPFAVKLDAESRPLLMSGKYDHVVIDSQITPDSGELGSLCKGSDLVIVPTTPEPLAISATGKLFAEASNYNNLRALLCMVPPSPQTDGVDALESLRAAKIPHFKRMIRRSKVYINASETGADMSNLRGRMPTYWRDWIELGKELKKII